MKFVVTQVQEFTGYRLTILVTADVGEELEQVRATHNGSSILNESLPGPGHASFSAVVGAGVITPGIHRVVITGRLHDGKEQSHTHVWSDQA